MLPLQPIADFLRQGPIGLGPLRRRIIGQHRQGVRRRFADSHIARDHRPEHQLAQIFAGVGLDLLGQVVAAIIHRQHNPFDPQVRIGRTAHVADGQQKLAETFQRKKLALQRHKHGMRGDQRIDRQQTQRRRTVDQHDVKGPGVDLGLAQRVMQQETALFVGYKIDVGRSQI